MFKFTKDNATNVVTFALLLSTADDGIIEYKLDYNENNYPDKTDNDDNGYYYPKCYH